MTCVACEHTIESRLVPLEGVLHCKANYVEGLVRVSFDRERIDLATLKRVLTEIHYPVSEEEQPREGFIKQWLSAALILAALIAAYILLEQTNVFYLFPLAEQDTALPLLFSIGLFTSIHCVAMCGGIVISQCAVPGEPGENDARRLRTTFWPGFMYNAGRVVAYTIVGGLVGALGGVVTPSGTFRGSVAIVAGVLMLLMGMNTLGVVPFLRRFTPRLPKALLSKVRGGGSRVPFVVGLLNGLMPCGPLQAMQLYALSTGNVLQGALAMLIFSLGTVPLMLGLGMLSSYLNARFTAVMLKVSAVLVMLLGVMMLNNGLSLSGILLY